MCVWVGVFCVISAFRANTYIHIPYTHTHTHTHTHTEILRNNALKLLSEAVEEEASFMSKAALVIADAESALASQGLGIRV